MNLLRNIFWYNNWTISISMGILLGFSFPPFPFPLLVFPAFILLFRLVDLSATARQAAYWSYPGFVIWNLIVTYWLMMAQLTAGIAAILANAAVMTLPVMLQHKVQKKVYRFWLIALLQTAFWVSYEYLHHHWDLAWPWLSLGNAFANFPRLIQYISATGYLGISFWAVLTAALAYQAIKDSHKTTSYATLFVALIFPAISLLQLPFVQTESDQHVTVDIIQPNFNSYYDNGGFNSPMGAMHVLTRISDSIQTDKTQLILWPENGIYPSVSNRRIDPAANHVKHYMQALANKWNSIVIGGTLYFDYFDSGKAPDLARGHAPSRWLPYNAALAFYPDSSIRIYRKHNLVPIVERIPFVHFLNAIDIFHWVDWKNNQEFGRGYDSTPFSVDGTSAPALVCYDSVFPGWVRKFVNNGAGFLTVITNDGWWGDTSGHEQHFAYARLRAVEFRRWVARSANNGISGIIAPDGSIKKETKYWKRTAFSYSIPVMKRQTFYARFGEWLPSSMLVIAILGILLLLRGYLTSLSNYRVSDFSLRKDQ